MNEPVFSKRNDLCQICQFEEATEQLPNESGMFVCYSCKIFQRDVVVFEHERSPSEIWDDFTESMMLGQNTLLPCQCSWDEISEKTLKSKMDEVTKILNDVGSF